MTPIRIRLDLAYDGTHFHGWARQGHSELRTVQQVLEDALTLVLRQPIALTVAGRTDAGVHAVAQVAHFDVPAAALDTRSIAGDPGRLVRRLARLLPTDVRVHAATIAPPDFDARFSALRRHYVYRLTTHPRGALPTRVTDTAHHPKPVDLAAMQACAAELIGLHDFAAFCRHRDGATTIRDLQDHGALPGGLLPRGGGGKTTRRICHIPAGRNLPIRISTGRPSSRIIPRGGGLPR